MTMSPFQIALPFCISTRKEQKVPRGQCQVVEVSRRGGERQEAFGAGPEKMGTKASAPMQLLLFAYPTPTPVTAPRCTRGFLKTIPIYNDLPFLLGTKQQEGEGEGVASICTTGKDALKGCRILLIKMKFTPYIAKKHMPARNTMKPNSPPFR